MKLSKEYTLGGVLTDEVIIKGFITRKEEKEIQSGTKTSVYIEDGKQRFDMDTSVGNVAKDRKVSIWTGLSINDLDNLASHDFDAIDKAIDEKTKAFTVPATL